MVMLSDLLRYRVLDAHDVSGRLSDLAVDIGPEDYPRVSELLLVRPGQPALILPWSAVTRLETRAPILRVEDLDAGSPAEAETLANAVLLKRDILDVLMIDLQERRATRANDLWLEEEAGQLRLCAAATGVRAIVHRITRGRLGRPRRDALLDWKYVEFLRGDPQAVGAGRGYARRITRLPVGDIARLTDQIPYLHAAELLNLAPDTTAAGILESMTAERQLQVFEELDEEHATQLLALMRPDLAADLIGRLHPDGARHFLERLPQPGRGRLLDLLRYPPSSAGGIMTPDFLAVPRTWTVAKALAALRDRLTHNESFVQFIYVVEDEESWNLRGVMSLRKLLLADEDRTIEDLLNPYVVTVHVFEPARVAARRVLDSELAALPVVGKDLRLLGVVTLDAAFGQIAPQSLRVQAPRLFT